MRLLLLVLFLCICLAANCQKKVVGRAISTEGRRILLYDDNTYSYETTPVPVTRGSGISDTTEDLFYKPIGEKYQTSPYNKKAWNSDKTHFSVFYDPKKWKLNLLNNTPPQEASLYLRETVCTILTERIDVDLQKFVHDTKLFYKQNHPSMKIQKEEWRVVNGLNVYYVEWQTGDNRTNFQCYSSFAMGKQEVLQLHIATPVDLAGEFKGEIERLLTGIVLNEK